MQEDRRIRREIMAIMLPIMLENLLQVMVNFAAAAMVGRLAIADISAQGMANKICDTVYYLFRGLGVGLSVHIARHHAAGHPLKCRSLLLHGLASVICLGILLTGLIGTFPAFFIRIFSKETDEAFALACGYLPQLAWMLSLWGITTLGAAYFQGLSDTRTPLKIAVFTNLVNLLAGYLLIFGKAGFPAMGLAGTAVSILLSRGVGSVIYIVLFIRQFRRSGVLRARLTGWRSDLRDVYSTGLPAAGETINWQISSILLSILVLTFGDTAFSAYQLGLQAEFITDVPAVGFSIASATLLSAARSHTDSTAFSRYYRQIIRVCAAISLVSSLTLFFGARLFMSLLTDKPVLIDIGVKYVAIMGLIQIPQGLTKVTSGALRAVDRKLTPMLIQLAGVWLIRLPCAYLCVRVLMLPLWTIWVCIAADQVVKYLISTVCVGKVLRTP